MFYMAAAYCALISCNRAFTLLLLEQRLRGKCDPETSFQNSQTSVDEHKAGTGAGKRILLKSLN